MKDKIKIKIEFTVTKENYKQYEHIYNDFAQSLNDFADVNFINATEKGEIK